MNQSLLKSGGQDICLVSYPRSGNTWIRYLLANAMYPHQEWNYTNIDRVIPDMYVVGDKIKDYPKPRVIKSHEPFREDYSIVIYLYRDGRDVAVSYFDYVKKIQSFEGLFSDFLRYYLSGQLQFGSWHDHVYSWAMKKHKAKCFAVSYEDLHASTFHVLESIIQFIGMRCEHTIIQRAIDKCTLEWRREDVKRYNPYYRRGYRGGVKGGPGKWKEVFSREALECFWKEAGEVMMAMGYEKEVPCDCMEDKEDLIVCGENLFKLGNIKGAVELFQQAIIENIRSSEAHNNLGVVYWHEGELKKALEHFMTALGVNSNNRSAILNCGDIFSALDRPEDARNIYLGYLEGNPDDKEITERMAEWS